MKITMVGHSTLLIEAGGKRMLTDPYFGSDGNAAYARVQPPFTAGLNVTDVDLVLVTHNHWDHTDRNYFTHLPTETQILAPRRSAQITQLKGGKNVVGVRNWERISLGSVTIIPVPALHTAVACGYVIETKNERAYFAGDTYCRPFMLDIAALGLIDVAMMPVTTFRIPMTMGEKGAVEAVKMLMPTVVIPIHLGIVPRSSLLRTQDSPLGFQRRLQQASLPSRVVILNGGESWSKASVQNTTNEA